MWFSGMGTEVQAKMHLPGYHSTRDLNDSATGGGCPLYHKSKTLKNEQYHGLFSTRLASDAFLGCDKETLRQTILKHESVFRHQLHELHRLYKKQMDLMNGVKKREQYDQSGQTGLSQSIFSSYSAQSLDDKKRWRAYSQNADTLKDCKLLEAKCKKPQRLLIDLELPADEYISNEEEQLNATGGGRDEDLSIGTSLRSECRDDSSNSKPYLRTSHGLTDLNEPAWIGKASTSASVDIPNPPDRISNLHLQNERNKRQCLPYTPKAGQTLSDRYDLHGSFCPDNGHTLVQNPLTYEHATVLPDHKKMENRSKRTIFGVEISDSDQNASVLHFASAEPSGSPQRRLPNALNQFLTPKGHHCSNTSAHSNVNPKMLMSCHEFPRNTFCDSKPIPSLRAEIFFQDGLDAQLAAPREASTGFDCTNGTSDGKSFYELFPKHGQVKYLKGLNDGRLMRNMSTGSVPPNGYRNEVLSQQNFAPNDLLTKHENSQGGLSWLREMLLHHNNELSKTGFGKSLSQGLCQDISSATQDQGCEVGKNKVGECSSNSEVLGLPFFHKPRVSKDMSSPTTPAKPNYLLSAVDRDNNSVKFELFEVDSSHDSFSAKSEEQCKAEGQLVEKQVMAHSRDFRYHIDLNLSMTEELEEAQLTPSSPKIDVNISAEIDLELAVVGAERAVTPKGESPESILNGPFNPLRDDTREPNEDHIKNAAEALVAISSSQVHNLEVNVTSNGPESSLSNSLSWFAEIVVLVEKEQDPDEVDYFEIMTLRLSETKVEEEEEHHIAHDQAREESKDEIVSTKRPRRGQARRGRQRKDFQRDVLPGLVALSRYEVTEDLQLIEGLIGASGGTWEASLSRRRNGGKGRGRRNSSDGSNGNLFSSTAITSASLVTDQAQQFDEKSLMGWGKRTRRLPRRQRWSNVVVCKSQVPVTTERETRRGIDL